MKDKIKDYAKKKIKDKIMGNSSSDKNQKTKHADTVIKNHIVWAMGASFIPLPIIDVFAVSGLQLDMVKGLCRVYDIDFSETQGKAIVTTLTSSALARIGARSLLKLIPGVGTILGGVTLSIFNGASTYAMGEVFKQHFSSGGTFLDFDTERLKKFYREKFEKGKKVAEELRKEEATEQTATKVKTTTSSKVAEEIKEEEYVPSTVAPEIEEEDTKIHGAAILERLKELSTLKDEGVISEKEFEKMKKKLIDLF